MIDYIFKKTVGGLFNQVVVGIIWQGILQPIGNAIIWSVKELGIAIGKGVYHLSAGILYGLNVLLRSTISICHKFVTLPFVYNFLSDLAKIPMGFFNLVDGIGNSLFGSMIKDETGKICTSCNVLNASNYGKTFYENFISISIYGVLGYHFTRNIDRTFKEFNDYNHARSQSVAGLQPYRYDSFFAMSTMGLCVAAQGSALLLCGLSALSANQFPRNKFTVAAAFGASELIMRGYTELLKSLKNDLDKVQNRDQRVAKNHKAEVKKLTEANEKKTAAMATAHKSQVTKMTTEHKNAKETLVADKSDAISKLEKARDAKIAEMTAKHEKAIQALRGQKAAASAAHRVQVQEMGDAHKAAVEKVHEDYKNQIETLEAEKGRAEELRDEAQAKATRFEARKRTAEGDLQSLRSRVEEADVRLIAVRQFVEKFTDSELDHITKLKEKCECATCLEKHTTLCSDYAKRVRSAKAFGNRIKAAHEAYLRATTNKDQPLAIAGNPAPKLIAGGAAAMEAAAQVGDGGEQNAR